MHIREQACDGADLTFSDGENEFCWYWADGSAWPIPRSCEVSDLELFLLRSAVDFPNSEG